MVFVSLLYYVHGLIVRCGVYVYRRTFYHRSAQCELEWIL